MLSITIKDTKVVFYTLYELASKCERLPQSLRKLEKKGILPEANFRTPDETFDDFKRRGKRLYSEALVEEIALIFSNEVRKGVTISEDTKIKLRIAFKKEKELLQ